MWVVSQLIFSEIEVDENWTESKTHHMTINNNKYIFLETMHDSTFTRHNDFFPLYQEWSKIYFIFFL